MKAYLTLCFLCCWLLSCAQKPAYNIDAEEAGADGNVSQILLPSCISTMISGICVFYPDGTPTQRVGVKIDHFLKPTIKGTIEGRDELLEKAKEILKI